jgi:hypothetical protein
MAKRNRSNGSSAIARRLAEGRGQGRRADFRPWLRVQDVPSCGLASRIRSPITSREHHLLSELERSWFLVAHAHPNLRDYREQFPLPLDETTEIANKLRIKHPIDPKTREPQVMTTDFIASFAEELCEVEIARAIKPAEHLVSTRVLEKLEIERLFWECRKVDWSILTERELPLAMLKNMRWLFPCLELEVFSGFTSAQISLIQMTMKPGILESKQPLLHIAADCDANLGLKPGTALLLSRHFIGTRVWPVDLNEPIDPRTPLRLLSGKPNHDIIRQHAT